jgi:oxygen-independent coproporphyrinogen-3 oxidase
MSFIQNHKDLKAYEQEILNNNLPISLGHTQTTVDLVTQKLILGIMCEDSTTLTPNLPYMNEIEEELKSFVDDGLISLQSDKIELTDLGKVFMRNIAMSFDYHLRDQIMSTKFSQTV